jgi:Wiskott-Aldrich syndrome protein
MSRRDRPHPPDPTDFDPTRDPLPEVEPEPIPELPPEKQTPGVQVQEATGSTWTQTARPADSTDMDWHATPQQADPRPIAPPAPPPTSTPGPPPTDTLLVHSPPAPLWTPTPLPEAAAPPPTPPPPMPALGAAPTPAPAPRAPVPTEEPARPRRQGEPMSFVQRAVQIVVLSLVAGGLAAVIAVVASALTAPGSDGLSVVVPAETAPEAPAPP